MTNRTVPADHQGQSQATLCMDVQVPDSYDSTCDFQSFVREQYGRLVQFLRSRTVSAQDAEDVAQESVIKMMRYRASVPESKWPPLLYRIASNAAYDQYRSVRRRCELDRRMMGEGVGTVHLPSPDELAVHEQQRSLLRQAILTLPPKCQRVYLLKLAYGITNAEIAERCDVSVKMVEKHLATGLGKLQREVGKTTDSSVRS